MKTLLLLILTSCLLLLGCKNPTENKDNLPTVDEELFPDEYLEAGYDSNYTFISLLTLRLPNGTLEVEAVGYGIEECGILFGQSVYNKEFSISIRNGCQTHPNPTWVTKTFRYIVTKSEEATLQKISFTNNRYTLQVVKQKVVNP